MVGISGESAGPIPKGLGLLAALSKSKSFSIVLSLKSKLLLLIEAGLIVPSYAPKADMSVPPVRSSIFQSPISASSVIIKSPGVSADRVDSELDLRLYPEDSEDESLYEPAEEVVEGVESDCCTHVSSSALSGSGLLAVGAGDPKLRYCDVSVAKSSARNMPGLLAASKLESKNSKSGSKSKLPDISESIINGGELAEYTVSAEVCMTLYEYAECCDTMDRVLRNAPRTMISSSKIPAKIQFFNSLRPVVIPFQTVSSVVVCNQSLLHIRQFDMLVAGRGFEGGGI